MKIGILIDSGASWDKNLLEGTNIETIPLHFNLEDGQDFLDTQEFIDKVDVFKRIDEKEKIKTSMASIGEVINKYDEMFKKYDHILHITIPPNLSGMRQTAILASQEDEFKGKVTVIDHSIAANAITYLARAFDLMIKNGETDIDTFKKVAQNATRDTLLILIPGDFARLNSGGRTKAMLVSILKLLKIKVAIRWGEKPEKFGTGRTLKIILDKIEDEIKNSTISFGKFLLVHSQKCDKKYIEQAKEILNNLKLDYVITMIPNVYPIHAGNDTIGIIGIPTEITN